MWYEKEGELVRCEKEGRMRNLFISQRSMLDVLRGHFLLNADVPQDFYIVNTGYDLLCRGWAITIVHPSFEQMPDGACLPTTVCEYVRRPAPFPEMMRLSPAAEEQAKKALREAPDGNVISLAAFEAICRGIDDIGGPDGCPECHGTGFYEGLNKTEPCSRGCKAP